ncbi:MAG: hypothetical protein HY830_10920 [Actinobacteria bacterium]|nr:hypothetical protein [Actinomycetota bacterium]
MTGPARPARAARAIAAVVLLALATGGCGAKEDDAKEMSEAVVERLNDGACDDPPADLPAAQWESMCRAVRAVLPAGGAVTLASTTVEQSGEIGYAYTSEATFTATDGTARTLRLFYEGTGVSAAVPELTYASMDGEVLLDL